MSQWARKMSQSFYIEKTGKQNTKTACAKSSSCRLVGEVSDEYVEAPRGGKEGPQGHAYATGRLADLRRATDSSLRLDAYRRGSYRLTPATPGLRAPARRDRQAKPRALSGRGARLDTSTHAQQGLDSKTDRLLVCNHVSKPLLRFLLKNTRRKRANASAGWPVQRLFALSVQRQQRELVCELLYGKHFFHADILERHTTVTTS